MNFIKNTWRPLARRWGLRALLALGAAPAAQAQSVDDFQARVFTTADGHQLPYRLFVPANYDPARKYPVVLFLHGLGERGTDNRAQLEATAAPLVFVRPENQARWPAFMVAPQCPPDELWSDLTSASPDYAPAAPNPTWPLAASVDLLQALGQEFAGIDAGRQIITGLSMGGSGTWDAITRYPGLFQKAVPVCGVGDPALAPAIAGLPLWTFHSADDPQMPVAKTRLMVQALRQAGGAPLYTEYCVNGLPCYGHAAWEPAYATPDLLPWLFGAVQSNGPTPPTAVAFPDTVAQGKGTTLLVTNPQNGVVYSWDGPGLQSNMGGRVAAIPPDQGQALYTVTVTDSSGLTATAQLTVTVTPPDSVASLGKALVSDGRAAVTAAALPLAVDVPAFAVSLASALSAAQVVLYPNPARDAFTVFVPVVAGAVPVQATLLNALGQVVRRQTAATGTAFTVETAALAAGFYTLRLQAGTATLAKRVVLH